MAFTRERIIELQKELNATLQAFAAKNGMTVSPSKITYDSATFKVNTVFGDAEATGGADPVYLNDMKRYGWQFGLSEADIGKSINTGSKGMMEILGMRASKVIVKSRDGKMYKYDAAVAKTLLAAAGNSVAPKVTAKS